MKRRYFLLTVVLCGIICIHTGLGDDNIRIPEWMVRNCALFL